MVKKWLMIVFIGCFLVMPVLAHAQLDKLLEGLLGRDEGVSLNQLSVTQMEMIPDPAREGQRVSFRATISNSSRNHVRIVLAVMDRDRVVSQVSNAYLGSGDTQINFPETSYPFSGRDERCFTIETNIDGRWVPITMASEFCPRRSNAGWSTSDRGGVGQLQVEELLMSPDPITRGQEVRFMVRLRNDGRPIRGNIRIQDRDQVVVQTDTVNIPRGLTDFQLPRSQYTFQRMDTCFTVSVDIERTPYPVDASKEYCANPTAWTLKSRPRDRRDDRDIRDRGR